MERCTKIHIPFRNKIHSSRKNSIAFSTTLLSAVPHNSTTQQFDSPCISARILQEPYINMYSSFFNVALRLPNLLHIWLCIHLWWKQRGIHCHNRKSYFRNKILPQVLHISMQTSECRLSCDQWSGYVVRPASNCFGTDSMFIVALYPGYILQP